MANEDKKDFNEMLRRENGMPKIQIVTDAKTIEKYGGERIPAGKLTTVGEIRRYFAEKNDADFTDPITAGIFVSIAAWASEQRQEDKTPYWRTLKANGELNPKYPGGVEAQKMKLEAEGLTIVARGRTNIRYYVKDYEENLFPLG